MRLVLNDWEKQKYAFILNKCTRNVLCHKIIDDMKLQYTFYGIEYYSLKSKNLNTSKSSSQVAQLT